MDQQKFLRAAQLYVRDNFPGLTAKRLTVEFHQPEESVVLPVPRSVPLNHCPRGTVRVTGAKNLKNLRQKILSVIPENDQEPVTWKALARMAEVKPNSRFRETLGRLKSLGFIESESGMYRKSKPDGSAKK